MESFSLKKIILIKKAKFPDIDGYNGLYYLFPHRILLTTNLHFVDSWALLIKHKCIYYASTNNYITI